MLNAAEAEVEKTKEAPDGTRWHESIRFAVPSRPSRKISMISLLVRSTNVNAVDDIAMWRRRIWDQTPVCITNNYML